MFQDIAYSWVSTEVDHTIPIKDKPKKNKFENMGKSQIRRYWESRVEISMKNKNEGMENIYIKNNSIQKLINKSTIESR